MNAPLAGFDTDRAGFLGPYNGFEQPQAAASGDPGNTIAHGWSPIASHCIELTLAPGERRDLVFQLGYVELPDEEKWAAPGVINKQPALELMSRYDSGVKAESYNFV